MIEKTTFHLSWARHLRTFQKAIISKNIHVTMMDTFPFPPHNDNHVANMLGEN